MSEWYGFVSKTFEEEKPQVNQPYTYGTSEHCGGEIVEVGQRRLRYPEIVYVFVVSSVT